ncbi:MAG: TIGR02710 family CRISPR-associated CARF protein [Lachnospiraceae bacterium]|nr:TIGR02710 family CRISPR-associated CARF protein [Lachnospiraceae bacterium]
MNQELLTMTEKWKALERKTEKQREKADAFYETKLMKLIEQEFIENNRDKVYEQIEYLILSVGTSYEPLVLNIQLLQPRRILFLYTKKTEYVLEKIVKYCRLDAMRFSKREVNETDPLDIYREIKAAYLKWDRPEKLYIDFTGGTKSMSAAAAMAGAVINVQLVYVGTSDYLPHFRKPNPGTETLYYISNPMEVFGDLEIEKAFALFDKYNYSGAREKLRELKDSVPTPDIRQQLTFVYYLAQTYEYWDALEFRKAYKAISVLTRELERDSRLNRNFLMMDFFPALKRQEAILKQLSDLSELLDKGRNMDALKNKDYIIPLMFTMYINAEIRRKQEKYDTATLLLYRLLEMIEQRRLAMYNLFVSRMNYADLEYNLERQPQLKGMQSGERLRLLTETVVSIKTSLFKRNVSTFLPDKISLLEGFILLLALNDEISETKSGKPLDKLKRIRSMVYLRNNSIFAHGLGPVSETDFKKFRAFVLDMFREFCAIEGIDFEKYAHDMEWLNPLHSKNYAGMEVSELWR